MHRLRSDKSALDNEFVVVVTTNTSERKAVLGWLSHVRTLESDLVGSRAYLGDLFGRLVVVIDGAGGFAHDASATRSAMQFLSDSSNPKPRLLVVCGVCWGNPKKTKTGDVLIATSVISLNRAIAKEGNRTLVPYQFSSNVLASDAAMLQSDGVVPGATILSLEENLQDTAQRDAHLAKFSDAYGGEMEAFAIIPECVRLQIPWLVIKAVSDFGEQDFERTGQPAAAAKAADSLALAIEKNLEVAAPSEYRHADRRFRIIQELHGNEMLIKKESLDLNNIKVQIHDMLPQLRACLAYHTGAAVVSNRLPQALSATLLELALNFLMHGGASQVHIGLSVNQVILRSDGRSYDPALLAVEPNGRGGQITWEAFFRDFEGIVVYTKAVPKRDSSWTNQYEFLIQGAAETLLDVRRRCSVAIDFSPTAKLSGRGLFHCNPECNVVHVDLSPFDLISVVLDVVSCFQDLLRQGKKVIVFTPNSDVVKRIRRDLADKVADGSITIMSNY